MLLLWSNSLTILLFLPKCASHSECEEWVSALRSAIKRHSVSLRKRSRAKSIYNPEGQKFLTEEIRDEYQSTGNLTTDVKVRC